ncbi:AsmA family protein [Escherichia coli]
MRARRLKLKELMPDVELMQKTLGESTVTRNYAVAVTRWRRFPATSNGNLKLLMNDGLVSRNLMEIVGLNVGQLHCRCDIW